VQIYSLLICRWLAILIVVTSSDFANAADAYSFTAVFTDVAVTPSAIFVKGLGLGVSGNGTRAVRLSPRGAQNVESIELISEITQQNIVLHLVGPAKHSG
jgi:hypothetical protein